MLERAVVDAVVLLDGDGQLLEAVAVSALNLPRFPEPDAGQQDGVVSHPQLPRLSEPDAGQLKTTRHMRPPMPKTHSAKIYAAGGAEGLEVGKRTTRYLLPPMPKARSS